MDGQNRDNIRPGMLVDIVLKADQPTGKLTRGVVRDILTSKRVHPRGIKVRLASGQVGRVQAIVAAAASDSQHNRDGSRSHSLVIKIDGRQKMFRSGTGFEKDPGKGGWPSPGRFSGSGFKGRGASGRTRPSGNRTRGSFYKNDSGASGQPRPGFGERIENSAPPKRYLCPCCGFKTLESPSPGSYEICPVCYWEDDPLQAADPESLMGGNNVSLNQGKSNFAAFGACEARYIKAVRKPLPQEGA